jgi:hypothetical protein
MTTHKQPNHDHPQTLTDGAEVLRHSASAIDVAVENETPSGEEEHAIEQMEYLRGGLVDG